MLIRLVLSGVPLLLSNLGDCGLGPCALREGVEFVVELKGARSNLPPRAPPSLSTTTTTDFELICWFEILSGRYRIAFHDFSQHSSASGASLEIWLERSDRRMRPHSLELVPSTSSITAAARSLAPALPQTSCSYLIKLILPPSCIWIVFATNCSYFFCSDSHKLTERSVFEVHLLPIVVLTFVQK